MLGIGKKADPPGDWDPALCDETLEGTKADDSRKVIAGECRKPIIGARGDDQFIEGKKRWAVRAKEQRLARLFIEANAKSRQQMRSRIRLGQRLCHRWLEASPSAQGCLCFYQQHAATDRATRAGLCQTGETTTNHEHLAAPLTPTTRNGGRCRRQRRGRGKPAQTLEIELAQGLRPQQPAFIEPGRVALGKVPKKPSPAVADLAWRSGGTAGERNAAVEQRNPALLAPAGVAESAARPVQAEALGQCKPARAQGGCSGGRDRALWGFLAHRLQSYI